MFILVLGCLLDTSLRVGDQWTTERIIHTVQVPDHIDRQTVQTLSYSVEDSGKDLTVVKIKPVPNPGSESWIWIFHSNGTLAQPESVSDPDLERVYRMIWTATELREGLSWSRKWPLIPGLPEAVVSVKPTSRTAEDQALSVQYREGTDTRIVASIKLLNQVRVVKEISLTINKVQIPGSILPGTVAITERLKEIHLKPRL